MSSNDVALEREIHQLNARAWGLATGLVLGVGLLVATNILVLKGGPDVGAHLELLAIYFPGYSVSFAGSLIGFVYAFVLGYILGRVIGAVYEWLTT